MTEKITEGKGNWRIRDGEAWEAAAAELRADGWTQELDRYRNATFTKDDQTVALVRNLGVLNWHPAEV